ncbi:MAG TPA: copper transporter [Gaiellaceae bacterium]|nr:copper transporter [Gaiellaceae bacterium]
MFDLRYHVASLAAVFLALIIGILVGVGISDRGLVDRTQNHLLRSRLASLQQQLDRTAKHSTDLGHQQQAARTYVNETYPLLVRNRLKGKQIAVVFVGSVDGGLRSAVSRTLTDAGAQQLRLRALKVPIDVDQLERPLNNEPAAVGLRGRSNVDRLGRALGQELALGGETPLWNSLNDALVEERTGGNKMPADGVVVVRTTTTQRGATARFLLGLYDGLASVGVPAVGVEQTDASQSATPVYQQAGLSSVDDLDTPVGRLGLVLLLQGASPGQYGVKDSAGDGALPPLPTTTAAAGG